MSLDFERDHFVVSIVFDPPEHGWFRVLFVPYHPDLGPEIITLFSRLFRSPCAGVSAGLLGRWSGVAGTGHPTSLDLRPDRGILTQAHGTRPRAQPGDSR